MDIRDTWLFKVVEQQTRRDVIIRNGEFMRRIRDRQSVRQVQSARLRLAACAAVLAWLFAARQHLL